MKFSNRKSLIILSLLLCIISSARSFEDEIDESIYDIIEGVLSEDYAKDNSSVGCLVEYLKENKIAEKFYRPELFFEIDVLKTELEPYLPAAATFCKTEVHNLAGSSCRVADRVSLILSFQLIAVAFFASHVLVN